MSDFQETVAEAVRASRAIQGLPPVVTDAAVLSRIAVLLWPR